VGRKTKIKKKKLTARIIITSDSAIWLAETGIFYVIDLRMPKESFNRLHVTYTNLVNAVDYFILGYCCVPIKLYKMCVIVYLLKKKKTPYNFCSAVWCTYSCLTYIHSLYYTKPQKSKSSNYSIQT